MIETIIKVSIMVGAAVGIFVLIGKPFIFYISCIGDRSFKEVWVDVQKHNIRLIRRLVINDLTKCPTCGSIAVEYVQGKWYHCLKCTYIVYDKEFTNETLYGSDQT